MWLVEQLELLFVCVCVCVCVIEREKPVSEQRGSVQCQRCKRWFRSKGGLAVHRCKTQDE